MTLGTFLWRMRLGRIAAVLFCLLVIPRAPAPAQLEENRRFVLEPWRIVNNVVIIPYELVADKARTYDLGIVLRRRGDPSFQILPKSVSGAVGRGQFAGGRREIRWEYLKDLPQGLIGSDYYFSLTAEVVPEETGWPWWYYAAGGAVIAGAAVAIFSGSEATTPIPSVLLPEPPGTRPNP